MMNAFYNVFGLLRCVRIIPVIKEAKRFRSAEKMPVQNYRNHVGFVHIVCVYGVTLKHASACTFLDLVFTHWYW